MRQGLFFLLSLFKWSVLTKQVILLSPTAALVQQIVLVLIFQVKKKNIFLLQEDGVLLVLLGESTLDFSSKLTEQHKNKRRVAQPHFAVCHLLF